MRLGIFGGTFDPPHRAHAMAVLWALQSGEVDRVLVVPMARHPFGKDPAAPFAERVAMCRLLVAEFAADCVEVSDIEGRREGVSYTIDTVRHLAAERPGVALRLVVGTDIIDDLPRWREGEELVRLAPPLVVPRIVEDARDERLGLRPGALPMLSSTLIREMLARGQDVDHLLPRRIADRIRERKLYHRDDA